MSRTARAHIDTDAGLHRRNGEDPEAYWAYLQARLTMSVYDCVSTQCKPTTILAAGDGAAHPRVRAILDAVTASAQQFCDAHPPPAYVNRWGEREPRPEVQLLLSEDPEFAGAKGAAFSMQTYYWDYCGPVNMTEANALYWNLDDPDDGGYWIPVPVFGPKTCEEVNCRRNMDLYKNRTFK